jgi:hypothetical protein
MTRQRQVSSWIVVIFIFLLPTRWSNGGGKGFSGLWETTNGVMTWNKPFIPGFDIRFASGKSALAIPFELEGHRIFLRVSVNGSPPLSFLLDTGASHTILDLRHAKSFGMRHQLAGKTYNLFSGNEPQDFYLVTDTPSFSLPGVVFSGQILVAISLEKMQKCTDQLTDSGRDQNIPSGQGVKEETRRAVDGYLGTGFFSNFVVEIDYAARLINLYDPQSYKYTERGKTIPLEMNPEKDIFVRAQIMAPGHPPVTARLLVDNGAGAVLFLKRQFAESHKLLPPPEKLMAGTGCEISGDVKEKLSAGTLEALQLSDFKISNPLTIFTQLSSAQDYDGRLGGLALRNFKVIFDYARSQMILESPGPVKSSK